MRHSLFRFGPARLALLLLGLGLPSPLVAAALRVPASTAYSEPDARGARINRDGTLSWRDPGLRVVWFGDLKSTGTLEATLSLRLPSNQVSKLRLTIAGQSREAEATGRGTNETQARFGTFTIPAAGPQRFTLESRNGPGGRIGDLDALLLEGPASQDAHFNLKSRRNAASVHLRYPSWPGTNIAAFYCEVTGVEEPVGTFYMACGWHRGYFGMQINSPTERRIIFSVWDSGGEAVRRDRVADENRAQLMGKGEGVYAGDFGNEGTGGHSHLKYPWKTGERQRFVVTAQPTNGTFTIFSGYWFHPEQKRWMLISSWRAPKDGGWLRGLHSFSENFDGSNGQLRRKALYGNQWVRTDTGQWIEIGMGSFSHDPTGRSDRRDRFMGVEDGRFFLSHGGFIPGYTKGGDTFTRPVAGQRPVLEGIPGLP